MDFTNKARLRYLVTGTLLSLGTLALSGILFRALGKTTLGSFSSCPLRSEADQRSSLGSAGLLGALQTLPHVTGNNHHGRRGRNGPGHVSHIPGTLHYLVKFIPPRVVMVPPERPLLLI